MSGASLLTVTLIVWGSVTVVFVVLMIFKSLAGMRENNILVLDPSESRQAAEQQTNAARVDRLTAWTKWFGFTSAALLLLTGGIWVYRGLIAFNGGLTP